MYRIKNCSKSKFVVIRDETIWSEISFNTKPVPRGYRLEYLLGQSDKNQLFYRAVAYIL